MRAILTWALVVVVCARQVPPGRELGAAALRLSIFPTSYLAHNSQTTTPSWLEVRLLPFLLVLTSLQVYSTTRHPCWRAWRKSLK